MSEEIYYKGTMKDGVSCSSLAPKIVYKLGTIVHPNPDRKSSKVCGAGIHLAKSFKAMRDNTQYAVEVYEARPGVILAEDDEKVRCASCFIVRKLSDEEIHKLTLQNFPQKEIDRVLALMELPVNCFVSDLWIYESYIKHPPEEFAKLSMTVIAPSRTVTMTTKFPQKEGGKILQSMIKGKN